MEGEKMTIEIDNLQKFLKGNLRNIWINTAKLNVYVRKGYHYINGELLKTLDIANISVNESYKRKGLGMKFIKDAYKINPFKVTYIENVLNSNFSKKLCEDDWLIVKDANPICYFKKS